MKLTLPQMIDAWNALDEIIEINDYVGPGFSIFRKRFQVKVRPEIVFWDGLTDAERISFMTTEIAVDLKPMPQQELPQELPVDRLNQIEPIVQGKMETTYMTKLEQIVKMKDKKEEVTHGE